MNHISQEQLQEGDTIVFNPSGNTNFESPKEGPPDDIYNDLYACGVTVKRVDNPGDRVGMFRFHLTYCELNGDSAFNLVTTKTELEEFTEPPSLLLEYGERCPTGYFIDGMRVRYCDEDDDDINCGSDKLGIAGLKISCRKPGDDINRRIERSVFCVSGYASVVNCADLNTWKRMEYVPDAGERDGTAVLINGANILKGPHIAPGAAGDTDSLGIIGIKLYWKEVRIPDNKDFAGSSTSLVTYTATWKGQLNQPTPIFATAIRGKIGYVSYEEESYGFQDASNELNFLENTPFGIADGIDTSGTVVLSNFFEVSKLFLVKVWTYHFFKSSSSLHSF